MPRNNLKEARQKAGMTQQENKIQTGLRVPELQYERLVAIAKRMGVSVNALILMLIDIGLNQIECPQEEQHHCFFHTHLDIFV